MRGEPRLLLAGPVDERDPQGGVPGVALQDGAFQLGLGGLERGVRLADGGGEEGAEAALSFGLVVGFG